MSKAWARRAWRCAVVGAALAAFGPAAMAATDPGGYAAQAHHYLEKGDLRSALIELRNAAQAAPADPKIRIDLAKVYLALGNPGTAEIEARMAKRLHAAESDYLPLLAEALVRQGKFADLLGQIQPDDRAPALESKVRVAIGLAESALHHEDKAEAALREAVRLDPGSVAAKLALARVVIGKNPKEAGEIVDRVLAAAPHLAEAIVVKGTVLRAEGDVAGALARFGEALKINPGDRFARVSRIEINLQKGDFAAVDADLDPILKASPDDVQANYLRADELARQKNFAAANAILQKIAPAFDILWSGYFLQGMVESQLGEYALAEQAMAKYLARVPEAAAAARLAADAALRQGAPQRAVGYVKPFADKSPPDSGAINLLGTAYMAEGKAELALAQFKKAAALEPKNPAVGTDLAIAEISAGKEQQGLSDLEQVFEGKAGATVAGPTLVLADLAAGRFDEAQSAAAKLVKRDPKSALFQTLLGRALLERGDHAAAEAALKAALQIDPAFEPAARNLVRLDLTTGRPDAALEIYTALLAKKPGDTGILLGLADIAVTQQKWVEAERYLNEARDSAPSNPTPAIALVKLELRRQHVPQAKAIAEQLAAQFPTNPDSLVALGEVEIAGGDRKAALSTYKRAYALAPNSAPILLRYVALLQATKNFAEAKSVLDEAVAGAPQNTQLKADLIRLQAQAGGLDAGLAQARSFAKADPGNPIYDMISAELYEGKGQGKRALSLLETAAASQPKNSELAIALAQLYSHDRTPEKAEALLQARLKADPGNLALQSALAGTYLAEKKYALATGLYQKLASEHPGDAAALNNLAWLYQQTKDLDKARQTAERALALSPGNAAIEDTLGWILLAQGKTEQAMTYLTAANALNPDDPSIQYHFAVALDRGGRRSDARALLEKLLASGAGFADKSAAEKLLQQLKSG